MLDKRGQPRDRYAYVGLPRKNGKSTLGAALAIYALLGMDEDAPHVYSCAGDRKQASIVFDEARRMVRAEPELASVVKMFRYHLEGPRNGVYRVLSADAELQQGLNPSFVIFDEVHVQPNRDLWDAMALGMGARERPLLVGITTAGYDRTSLCYDLYERGRRGEFYTWWREPADPNCDWQDEDVWYEANPALGDFLNLEAIRYDARVTPESSFRRYHLNQWTQTHTSWFGHGLWERAARVRPVDPEEPVVLFLDGSWSNDSTGLVGCTVADHHLFTVDLWTPDEELGHIDMAAVEEGVRHAFGQWNVRSLAFDPRGFQDFSARLEGEGFPIVSWPTNSLDRMVPACNEFYRAILGGGLSHDGDPRLAAHVANAVLKEDRFGGRIVKEFRTRKIDLAVCAVGAYAEARRLANVGPTEILVEWR